MQSWWLSRCWTMARTNRVHPRDMQRTATRSTSITGTEKKVIKGAEVSSFRSLGDTYFARDEKRIYAYGKQLPKAELTSWELLGHWYSRDARRVYYLNREIKGADRDSFTVCTPLDAPLLADHLARDKDHFYQNDEIIEETLWRERLQAIQEK